MLINSRTVFVVLLFFHFVSLFAESNKEIWIKYGTIVQKGPEVFLQYVRDNNIKAPLIHSKWYIDTQIPVETESMNTSETEKREFGRMWLIQLEEESKKIQHLDNTEDWEAKANVLLDLADWIGHEPGYGNLLLFSRLQDLANIPIAHLLADSNYPVSKLEKIVPRLLDSTNLFIKMGVSVLNNEAPKPVFEAGTVMPDPQYGPPRTQFDHIDDILAPASQTWGKNYVQAIKSIQGKGNDEKILLLSGREQRALAPKDLQFYFDDESGLSPFTALGQWDIKFHKRIILGIAGSKIKHSLDLLEFRKRVGKIPNPVKYSEEEMADARKVQQDYLKRGIKVVHVTDNPSYDPHEEAFEQAWRVALGKKMSEDDLNTAGSAYIAYRLVCENKLYDDDYENSKKWDKKQAMREKNNMIQRLDKQLYKELDVAREEWAKAELDAEQKAFELYILSRKEAKKEELEKIKLEEKEAREKAQKALERYKEADNNYKNLYKQ